MNFMYRWQIIHLYLWVIMNSYYKMRKSKAS